MWREHWLGLALVMAVVVGLAGGCVKKQQSKGTGTGKGTVTGTGKGTKKAKGPVTCRMDAKTRAALAAASDRVEVSDAEKTAWKKLLLTQCKGWPKAIEFYMLLKSDLSIEQRLRLKGPDKADGDRFDLLVDGFCKGMRKRFAKAMEKGPRGPSPRLWKHCGYAKLGVLTRREYGAGWFSNNHVMLVYQLLRGGGVNHREAKTLARLFMSRGRWIQKEGEMLLARSPALTESTEAGKVVVSASSVLVDNTPVANVKNGKVDANSKRDGPNGFFIAPLYKKLEARTKKWRSDAKSQGRAFPMQLLVLVHRGTPFRLVAEVLYTAGQAGYHRFQLGVHSNVATDAVYLFDTPPLQKAKTATTRTPVHVWMKPNAYAFVGSNGKIIKSFPISMADPKAIRFKSARAGIVKAVHARSVKIKAGPGKQGVMHIRVDDTRRYSDFIHLLEALLNKPGVTSGKGCRLVYEATSGKWKRDPATRSSCLITFPRLYKGRNK